MGASRRILIVDDERLNLELLEDMIACLGHEAETASDGMEALAKLRLGVDLVLLDVMMPGIDGFEVARRMRQDPAYADLPVIMVTALTGKEDRLRAVEAGANDFIAKPVDRVELGVRTASLLKMKEAQDAIKRHRAELEETVRQQTKELRQALEDLAQAQRETYQAHLDTIRRLAMAAEEKDAYTSAHIERVSNYCGLLARALNLPPRDIEVVYHASAMHDVGKLGIPDSILLKPGRLSEAEWEIMRQHTVIGARILGGSGSALLEVGKVIALSHHERWDGTGYPNGLAGEGIPLYGRICALADVFDALTSRRPYKDALANAEAYEIIQSGRGSHFDPQIVDLFFGHIGEVEAIQAEFPAIAVEDTPQSAA